MKSGIEIITEERQRQIEVEGWTAEHDEKHYMGELANAACCYAMTHDMVDYLDEQWGNDMYLTFWPFDLSWLKKDQTGDNEKRIKDLAKAGALIAAEIDRLQALSNTELKK